MGRQRVEDARAGTRTSRRGIACNLRVRATGQAGLFAAACLSAAVSGGPAHADILPSTGGIALAGDCALTLDGAVYDRCECGMVVTAVGGQYLLSGLNVGCQGRAGDAGALSGQIGVTGRSVQVLYDLGPTTDSGAGTWVTTSSASIDHVVVDEDWLLMTLRLLGPTHFENSRGKACIDGASGSRC